MMKTADAIAALREKTGAVQKAVAEGTGAVVRAAAELFTPAHADFSEVFKKELESIQQRGKAPGEERGGEAATRPPEFETQSQIFRDVLQELESSEKAWQSAGKLKSDEFRHAGLVGLALSGGGIRSATFNLGVLQALNEAGIFEKTHYLSTVSGGGYIGCCLDSLYSSGTARFPFGHRIGEVENQCFKHLREFSNYLAPHGLLDKLRMPALFLRGLFLNFVLILPFVLAAAGFYVLLIKLVPGLEARFREFYFTGWALLIVAASFLVYPVFNRIAGVARQSGGTWAWRDRATRALGLVLGVILATAFIELQPYALDAYQFLAESDLGGFLESVSLSEVVGAVVGLLTAISAIAGARRVRTSGTVTGNVGLYLVGILGPMLLWLLFLLLAKRSLTTGSGPIEDFVFEYAIPVSYFSSPPEDRALQYLLAGAIIFAVGWFVNVNDYSLHRFYRDRLSRCYLMKGDGSAPPEHNDEQKLSGVNTVQMPYHIVNAALNVTRQAKDRTDELRLPGRTAESFIFTKLHVGSELTGYCKTEKRDRRDC